MSTDTALRAVPLRQLSFLYTLGGSFRNFAYRASANAIVSLPVKNDESGGLCVLFENVFHGAQLDMAKSEFIVGLSVRPRFLPDACNQS